MSQTKAIKKARTELIEIQTILGALTMRVGSAVTELHKCELMLENFTVDEQKEKAQAALDACPKFDPDNEVEPVNEMEAEQL